MSKEKKTFIIPAPDSTGISAEELFLAAAASKFTSAMITEVGAEDCAITKVRILEMLAEAGFGS